MSDAKTIPFVVETRTKSGAGGAVGLASVEVGKLRASVADATEGLAEAFRELRRVGEFELTELTIGLEVSAEGGVSFIGTSKIAGGASLTMTFAPSNSRE